MSDPKPPADDLTWLALTLWGEARGEGYLGQAAVGLIILHRMALKYASNGDLADTVLWRFQFSGYWFAMEHEHYIQISKDKAAALRAAAVLLAEALKDRSWPGCLAVAKEVLARTFKSNSAPWVRLQAEPRSVLYYNPLICKAPAWALPAEQVCEIGHHSFFRAAA